ncbi:cupin domain-containing protein [Candidatus Poribacteria bacterium]|nr:cupin domain-containing protein [Candidatus Poribacteria bacterium]
MSINERGTDSGEEEPAATPKNSGPQKDCVVTREGSRITQDFPEGCLKLEHLVHEACSGTLTAVLATAEPGASTWEAQELPGDKWYYILKGKLEVTVNNSSHLLAEGDSIYLQSTGSHIWRNPTKEETKALVVASPL